MIKGTQIIRSAVGGVLNVAELYDGDPIPVFTEKLSSDARFSVSYRLKRVSEAVGDSGFMMRFIRFVMRRELQKRINEIAQSVFNDTIDEHCGAELMPRCFGRYGYGIMLSWRESVIPESSFMEFVTTLNQPDGGKYVLAKKKIVFDFKKLNESGETKKLYVVLVMSVRQ